MLARFAWGVVGAMLVVLNGVHAARVRKVAPAKTLPKKTVRPAKPALGSPASTAITSGTLAAALNRLGYTAKAEGPFQQIKIEEETFGYTIDLGFSKTGEWLVCMAHLAPVGDLTAVKSTPLLNLLAANDALLGMAFSYDRTNGRVMLNAAVPSKGLDATGLRMVLDRLQIAVHQNQGLWDTSHWQ